MIPADVFLPGLPFFIYEEAEIERSVEGLRKYWQRWSLPGFEIYFSVKVNPNPHILRIISKLVDGFDVSSRMEAELVWQNGVAAAKTTWSGPAKTNRALDRVLSQGLRCLHLDSVDEWIEIQRRSGSGALPKCSLRLSTSEIHNQKLGFSDEEIRRLRTLRPGPWHAVHSYLGRETFSQESMAAFHLRLDGKIADGLFVEPLEVFLGAGLPSRLILESELQTLRPLAPPKRVLHLESGRGLLQSAGSYGAEIISVKHSSSKKTAIVDGGLQHLGSHFQSPRFADRCVEVKFFRNGTELSDRGSQISLHGSFSFWHDTLIDGLAAPADLRRGDWIVANHVGAYGYTAGSNQFLAPSRIKEFLLSKDGDLIDISPSRLVAYQEAER